jgi:tRNA pseudouridine38-40 synthase
MPKTIVQNYKIVIKYDGTNYHGWQIQPEVSTIEKKIKEAILKICREEVKIVGASRTDAGVHAVGQTANFTLNKNQIDTSVLHKALNGYLPHNIKITHIEKVPENFNARHNTKKKHYRYAIVSDKYPVFLDNHAHYFKQKIDIEKIKEAIQFFIGRYDFSAFQDKGSHNEETIKNIENVTIEKKEIKLWFDSYKLIFFDIIGDNFLYHMVRIITGTLLEVGRGKIKPQEIKKIIENKDRTKAGPTLPAKGLCLMKIYY